MAIPNNIIDQIQERTDIVEVISRYIQMKKAGRSYKALCPFHNEKTPSFIVSPDKQIYHCFGCGAGGNVVSFLMRHENMTFPEAMEMLAQKAGIALPKGTSGKGENASLANQLYGINELAVQFFQACLGSSRTAREYLASRGVGDATIKDLRIGYAADAWEGLIHFFKKKGFDEAALEKAGLVIPNGKGGYYDRFRNRIIFPIMDLRNRVLGFGGRVLDASLPKYINSPETPIYSKGRNLYGLNLSKEQIKKDGHVLIVEGYMDFIIPFQAGVRNIIATLGTAFTVDQLKLLKRFTNTAIMVYDPDEAGEAATLRNLDLFVSEGVNVYIAELEKGFDPDGSIRKFGAEDFIRRIKSSKNLFDYKLGRLAARFDMKSAHGKAAIAAEMLPTISRIDNAVLRSNLTKKLADALSVDEEAIRIELKKVKPDYGEPRPRAPLNTAGADPKMAEKMILALMLDSKEFIARVKEELSPDEFKDSSIRDMVKAVLDLFEAGREISPARLINYMEKAGQSAVIISEAANLIESVDDKERALMDCVARVRKDNIKSRLETLQAAIRTAHGMKDEERVKKLIAEFNDLVKGRKA